MELDPTERVILIVGLADSQYNQEKAPRLQAKGEVKPV